jgi:uncharacterized protein YjbJ (UPF0337 family)
MRVNAMEVIQKRVPWRGTDDCMRTEREDVMGIEDKFDAAGDKLKGKVDEVVGKVTNDESRVVKGKAEQAKGSVKDTVADVKAHVKDSADEDRPDATDV